VCGSSQVLMITCGSQHTLVLTRLKQVWGCGAGFCGQNGSLTRAPLFIPTRVASLDNILMVEEGSNNSKAVGADRRAQCGRGVRTALAR